MQQLLSKLAPGRAKTINHHSWLFAIGLLLLVLYTLLKGLHPPPIWGFVHFLLDYSHGFIRRGFLGEFVSCFFSDAARSYHVHFYTSMSVLLLNFVLLLYQSIRVLPANRDTFLVTAIFIANPALLYFIHFVGYGEFWGLLVTLSGLWFTRFWPRFVFFACLMPVSILIHEINYVVFFPLQFIALLLLAGSDKPRRLVALLAWSALMLLQFFIVGTQGLSEQQAVMLYKGLEQELGFPFDENSVLFLADDLSTSLASMYDYITDEPALLGVFLAAFLLFLPSVWLCLEACYRHLEAGLDQQALLLPKKWLVRLCLLVPAAPLLLTFVAWDFVRWLALMVISAYVIWLIVAAALPLSKQTNEKAAPGRLAFMLSVLLFYLVISPPILGPGSDGFTRFPFTGHADYFSAWYTNRHQLEYGFWQ